MTAVALQYLNRVAARDQGTWFSIHYKLELGNGRDPIYPGSAHQNMRTALREAMYWSHKGHDVYLAMGAYINAGAMGKIYPKAIRQFNNLTACKCLYMDIDVKPGAFNSTDEAVKAMQAFVRAVALPPPTIIVMSGSGGFHVYWTLSELITPHEHRVLSGRLTTAAVQHNIHFDRQCTNDPTRLLRIADTWNFKQGGGADARKVVLAYDSKTDVDINVMRAALAPFPTYVTPASKSKSNVPDDNDDLALEPNYQAANIDVVAKDCPFIADTLAVNGANLTDDLGREAIWHHLISLACHTTDPQGVAHRLCSGHPFYTPEAVDAKLSVAQNQRQMRPDIGPPRCATIARDGVTHCNSCPHMALNTTPLSVPYKKPGGIPLSQFVAPSVPNVINDLPDGYYRGSDGSILVTNAKVDNGEEVIAFEYPILPGSGYVEQTSPPKLIFHTMQAGAAAIKSFVASALSDNYTLNKSMADEVLPITRDLKATRTFFMAYMKHLAQSRNTFINIPAFGWSQDASGDWGFAFAGEFFAPSGTTPCNRPGSGGDGYGVMGDAQPWRDLADVVLTPDRPDLCCMAATSFGAPLVSMAGEQGVLNGIWSMGSGIGKTTALILNQSVWSRPKNLGGLSDTVNYTFGKCALLRHLPVNYDEIKGPKQIQAFADIVIQLTRGGEKGRMARSAELKEIREFQTNINYAANGSILNAIREHDQGTDANQLRMFEMRGTPSTALTHIVSNVGRMGVALQTNFGAAGRIYAEYLGKNRNYIYVTMVNMQTKLEQQLGASQEERFWMAAIATNLVGASIANRLGLANFPLREMMAYMCKEYRHLHDTLALNPSDYSKDAGLLNALGAFLNERRERGMVILDKTWTHKSRPAKGFAKVLNDPLHKQWGRIDVQLSGDPLTLRVSDNGLGEWCGRTGRPKASLIHAMQDKLGATMSRATIGSGSTLGNTAENVWIIQAAGSILEPSLGEYIEMYNLKV